ncbi:surface lipoprotein assembly modifier [Ruixingdingia sedimenti]|uniref:Surface lipoprotein assembly modifier n=1 Tax=Ruixingdingia sedimenti TaxID=3073604 RepID=A0ABU1F8L3_9RHOB|nr:surface lipoprotein assembly modifier [Xinfangfangia sp. LG-4]MDR5653210.1 surface lipoprotein assembly modifier [Xinfangfangia sp. LG-4]
MALRPWIAALIFCLLPPLAARADPAAATLAAAERAAASGQAETAIALLEPLRPGTEADEIRRLRALAFAYGRQGRPRAAIAPLERLVALRPQEVRYRLELAAALAQAGQDDRARYHFELSRGAGLPPDVLGQVQARIDTLDRRKNWEGHFRFAIVPESNAARRTAAERVTVGGWVLGIRPAAREQPANGVELGFGLAALPRLGQDLRGRLGFSVQGRFFDSRAPDDMSLRVEAGLLRFADQGQRVTAEVFATRRWLNDKQLMLTPAGQIVRTPTLYSTGTGVSASYARDIGARSTFWGQLLTERLDYGAQRGEQQRTALSLQFTHMATARLHLRFGARIEDRSSDRPWLSGTGAGVNIGGQYLFDGGLRLGLDLLLDANDHEGLHPLFGVERRDRRMMVQAELTNQNWSWRGFAPVLRLNWERQKSTVVLNRYRNLGASVGLTTRF